MASSLPLRPPPPLVSGLHRPTLKSAFPSPSQFRPRNPNPNAGFFTVCASPASSFSSWEREEARWLREEQRWLREEQRWLREEARWRSERDALLREVAALRLRIDALDRSNAAAEPSAWPLLVEEAQLKEMVLEVKKEARAMPEEQEEKKKETRWRTLRKGAEGAEVRVMQEGLQRLGFYSGEEDMEYSSFSTGTERAVKTWQASLGTLEDGIMTTELLERLFTERETVDANLKVNVDQKEESSAVKDGANGVAIASVSEIAGVQETIVRDDDAEVQVSQQRVFLIGENRWEEPSRLVGRDKAINRNKVVSSKKCISCHGEGRLMCVECDGTGEPNVEPQFLEWIGEGAKCPYCEGLGYTICDVCEGNATVKK